METLARRSISFLVIACLLGTGQLFAQVSSSITSPKIRVVEGTTYPRTGQGIQSAIQDIGQSPGTVLLGPGVYEISSEVKISQPGIRIVGSGPTSTVLNVTTATGDVFNVTGSRFEIGDLGIRATVAKTSGSLVFMGGPEGRVHDIRIEGSFWNGFTGESSAGGSWSFETIRVIGNTTWNYFLSLHSPSRTIASTHVHNLFLSNGISWKTAAIILDTGVDTFICSDSELGPLLTQDSLKRQAPRWIVFTNILVEGGNGGQNDKIALQIDSARDLRFAGGYIASAGIGTAIGPGARGVQIASTEFVSLRRSAVTISADARDVSLLGNTFEDTGVEANNSFDTVVVSDGAIDFDVSHNMFKSSQSNRPRYNLVLPAKCPTCIAADNRFSGFVTGAISGGK